MMRRLTGAVGVTALAGALLALAACGQDAEETGVDAADNMATEDAPAATADAGAEAECDRACIIGVTDAYLAALVAHDPSAAPLAGDVAFVENVHRMQPGEGLWQDAVSGPTDFAVYVPDEELQSAAFMGVMRVMAPPPAPQGTSPEERQALAAGADKVEQYAEIAIRLQLDDDGRIVEAEHLVATVSDNGMSQLQTPRPGLVSEVPENARLSHDELARIGMSYYDALDDNDGSLMPFAADCERHENGMTTAGPNSGPGPNPNAEHPVARECGPQLDSKSFTYIERIENRRLAAADPVTGLVMGLSHFRHSMENLPYDVIAMDGTVLERNRENMPYAPFDMPAAHIFKIGADRMVHEIEAVGVLGVPYQSPTGWE